MRSFASGSLLAFASALVACGGGALPAPVTAPTGGPAAVAVALPTTPPADPFAAPKALREEQPETPITHAPDLDNYLAYAALHPATCAVAPARKLPTKGKPAACSRAPGAMQVEDFQSLGRALAMTDAKSRDAAIAALEGCAIPTSTLIAIRADYIDATCRDAIVDPYLTNLQKGKGTASAPEGILHLLVGHGLSAKLSRLPLAPPTMPAGSAMDTPTVKAFVEGPYKEWLVGQSKAIDDGQAVAFPLLGYGRGIGALASGQASLRLAESIRSAPVPASINADPELREVYEQGLEDAMEPRKNQGRDATLVALGILAESGVIHSPDVNQARTTLARMYGGRRIDALDALIIPVPPVPRDGAGKAKADSTPSFPTQDPSAGRMVMILSVPLPGIVDRVAPPVREVLLPPHMLRRDLRTELGLEKSAPSPFEVYAPRMRTTAGANRTSDPWLRAYAALQLGTHTWRSRSYDEVISVYQGHLTFATSEEHDRGRLYFALALALRNGPDSAAEMMRAKSPALLNLSHTAALEALAGEKNQFAGEALFDAAILHEVSPPEKATSAFYTDLAGRYRKAAELLSGEQKAKAHARAQAADELAQHVSALSAGH